MTNKEIYTLVHANIKDVYKVNSIEVTENFNEHGKSHIEIAIWVNNEYGINYNKLLAQFTLPENYDESIIQRLATASIDINDLIESYED